MVDMENLTKTKRFIKAVKQPFFKIDTEDKLDNVLLKAKVMKPLQQCMILQEPTGDILSKPRNDTNDVDDDEVMIAEVSMTMAPIQFTLKKFFELPHVFNKIEAHTKELREGKRLNHFVNGKLWNKKLENFDDNQTVIPYFLYTDGVQINNSLGPHCTKGSLGMSYITFPTIPTEYQSRLENIFLASVCPGNL